MPVELAQAGGVLGAVGLAALLVSTPRAARLAGLFAWAVGGLVLTAYLAPGGRLGLYVAAAAGVLAVAAALSVLFLRVPWALPALALLCVPARVPVALEGEDANLLVPLYLVVAGAAGLLAWQLLRGDRRARELGAVAWPLAAFVAWAGLSLLWSGDVREGAIALLAFFLPFGLLAVAIARLPWSRRGARLVFAQLLAMALAIATIGGYQWWTREIFWNPKVEVGNAYAPFYRVNSVFWDPSMYGRFLVLAILAALVVVIAQPRGRDVLLLAATIAALWLGLVVSFSQSSFTALVAGVLGAAAFMWGRRWLVGLAAAAAVLVSVGFATPSVRAELQRDLDRATSGRSSLVSNGVRVAADHPVGGVGLGGFRRAYADLTGLRGEEPRKAASHNTPVTVVAEQGVPGLLLFAWVLGTALVVAFRRASRSFAGRASLIVGLALMAIAVHSLFYDAFIEDPFTWGLLGLGAVVTSWREVGR